MLILSNSRDHISISMDLQCERVVSMNKRTVELSILKTLSQGNKIPGSLHYFVEKNILGDLIESLEEEGFIEGATVIRGSYDNSVFLIYLETTKITPKGREFLEDHQDSNGNIA